MESDKPHAFNKYVFFKKSEYMKCKKSGELSRGMVAGMEIGENLGNYLGIRIDIPF